MGMDINSQMPAAPRPQAHETIYHEIFDLVADAILLIDSQTGEILEANPATTAFYGYSREELLQKKNTDLSVEPGKTRQAGIDALQFIPVRWHRKKDGTIFPVEITASHIHWQGREVHVATIRDITTRISAQDEVQAQQAFLQEVIDTAPYSIFVKDVAGRQILSNKALARQMGVEPEQIPGKTILELLPEQEVVTAMYCDDMAILRQEQERIDKEVQFIDGQGNVRWSHTIKLPMKNRDGKVDRLIGIGVDITERKRDEQALQDSRERYRDLYNNAFVGLCRTSLAGGQLLECNQRLAEILGYTNRKQCQAEYNMAEHYVHPEHRLHFIGRMKAEGVVNDFETLLLDRQGRHIWTRSSARIYPERGYIEGCLLDITAEKQAEDALKQSEERYRRLVETMTEGLSIIDEEGRIFYANERLLAMLGLAANQLLGHLLRDFITERDKVLWDQRLIRQNEGLRGPYEITWIAADGHKVPTLMSPSPINDEQDLFRGCFAVITDLTEQKQLQEHISRAEKMESLGRLAGGVAHDLNNILSGIVSYPDLLLMGMATDHPMHRPLKTIQKAGERAAGVVEDLLTLTRRGVQASSTINLNQVVESYRRTPEFERFQGLHGNVSIEWQLSPSLLNIQGSTLHIGKTLMNLISNALEAMPEGGLLTVSTTNEFIDWAIEGYDKVQEGEYVVLTVADTGIGLSPEDRRHIFEPFYTSKVMGRSGTGLGLTVVWGTVKDHNGYIDVRSVEGEGSTFKLYFPATYNEMAKLVMPLPLESIKGNGQRILVVDDVAEQREISCRMLQLLGYQAQTAASGEAAIAYLKENRVELVLLDMIMDPGIDGLETYREIIKLYPGQKAIIVSGFAETDQVRGAQELGAGSFIKKPYVLYEIGKVIKETLDGPVCEASQPV